jgi:hypothetical protein
MGRYLGACVAFSVVYLAVAATTALYPAIAVLESARIGSVPVSRIALSLWWGIALHHYVVDQYIWRIKKDRVLEAKLAGA